MNRTLRLLVVLLFATCSFAQTASTVPGPYKPVLDRLQSITVIPLPEWQGHAADLAHGEDPALSTSDWTEVKLKQDWQDSRWLRRSLEVPAQLNGYSLQGARIALDLHVGSDDAIQVSVFANGSMVARTDEDGQVPITLIENAQPGQKLVLAVRVLDSGGGGCCGGNSTRIDQAELRIEPPDSRPDPAIMRQEIMSAELLIAAYPDGKARAPAATRHGGEGHRSRRARQGRSASLRRLARDAQTKLDVLRPYMKQFNIDAVGNSHIDMAWLWPWTETVEVVRNTFGTALELMREYPDFKFTASTAQAYEWIEEKYPAMFREIEQRVKEGRWEVIGGMWVEPDLNMPDGESLVRQILYGKRYFQQKFGVDINIGWNPDSFGYNWQLPQIYKRSGIDYFVTQKLLWAHEFTKFPYRLFWWEAPDGSRMLTYFPSDYANQIDPQKMARDSAAYGPMMWKYNGGTNSAPDGALQMMYLYGVGDHGGGPTRVDLDTALRWQRARRGLSQFELFHRGQYFAQPEQERERVENCRPGTASCTSSTTAGCRPRSRRRSAATARAKSRCSNAEKAGVDRHAVRRSLSAGRTSTRRGKKCCSTSFTTFCRARAFGINYVDAARKYAGARASAAT